MATVQTWLVLAAASTVYADVSYKNTCFYEFGWGIDKISKGRDASEVATCTIDDAATRGFELAFLDGSYDVLWYSVDTELVFGADSDGGHNYMEEEFPMEDAVISAVYLVDAVTTHKGFGMVWYGVRDEPAALAPIRADIVAAGLADDAFAPVWAACVTHEHVAAFHDDMSINTQQCVISDGAKLFLIWRYGLLTLVDKHSYYWAQPVINKGDGEYAWTHPLGYTADINDIADDSNCGVPGVFVFDVTHAPVVEPAPGAMCVPSAPPCGCAPNMTDGTCPAAVREKDCGKAGGQ